ncbi:hypothetical protein NIES2100_80020 (plasmid) [Calothrix sp. NIES-2100]|uniref:hypothetical protein n=1 Tax=Calothrix sp. NIES-2100 TaxID=1954172 RepID=UPI000B5FC972|nr:hypothetical protein NIES2100_80020 [Calothrix sp. NIES-2100]
MTFEQAMLVLQRVLQQKYLSNDQIPNKTPELTFEQAKLVVDTLLQTKHLSNIQELVLRLSCQGYTYAEIAKSSGYDEDYIRDVGLRLWQTLSKALDSSKNL